MSGYVADTEQILALVEKARQIGQKIEQRITDVERDIAALHIDWAGQAAEVHRAKHDIWQNEMSDMRSALADLESAAKAARDRYLANVAHNKGMWP
ncbi:WXG100 family type VII secretion target [Nocardia sp. NPDC052566]|uniref:WXG100 family type VII secretion target n=1 Tax=Nocardia sp. NPDC052566 TaxID=3364330 RepID=UPI0037CAB522